MKPEDLHLDPQKAKFALEALPDLFHQAPADFIKYLERDGNSFLLYYWNEVGKRLKLNPKVIPFGMDFAIHKLNAMTTIALVTLPRPDGVKGIYYEAFIHRPNQVMMFTHDTTRVAALIQPVEDVENTPSILVDISHKLELEVVRTGVELRREAFHQAVISLLKE
jgi:hypothetical protein